MPFYLKSYVNERNDKGDYKYCPQAYLVHRQHKTAGLSVARSALMPYRMPFVSPLAKRIIEIHTGNSQRRQRKIHQYQPESSADKHIHQPDDNDDYLTNKKPDIFFLFHHASPPLISMTLYPEFSA